jgi:NET1-associated nuclear protein 1 (U3 small nucleolar RNA-associated protein 17)
VHVPGGPFTCVAQCEFPHQGLISCVGVRPSAHTVEDVMAFTGGADGEFKIWVPNGRVSRGGEHAGWRCRSSASHPSGDAITAGAFSADGSIVASAASEIVLWDPVSNAKLATLAMPKSSNDEKATTIKSVAFVAGEPLFAAANGETLVIWNLKTLQPWRVFSMPCVDLNAHPTLPLFAATFLYDKENSSSTSDTHGKCFVVRFVGENASPAGVYACAGGAPQAVLFPPGNAAVAESSTPEHASMIIVTRDRQFIRVGAETNREARARDDMDIDFLPATKYFSGGVVLVGPPMNAKFKEYLATNKVESKVKSLNLEDENEDIPERDRVIGGSAQGGFGKLPWGSLFDSKSHELPPLTSLCPHFMHAMLSVHETSTN